MVFVESIHSKLKHFVMQMPTVLDVFSSFCPSLKEMKLLLTNKAKQRQKEEARHIEDTQRLVTEIEMLKVVLYLVSRSEEK
jgi:hypothetical protein